MPIGVGRSTGPRSQPISHFAFDTERRGAYKVSFPVSRRYGSVQPGASRAAAGPSAPRGRLGRRTANGRGLHLATFACDERLVQAPASPPVWPADHRSSSVLAFLCSCFPEGLPEGLRGTGWYLKDWGYRRDDVLPPREDRSTDGGIADSSRRKTPLVLPCEGERRRGPGFVNLWEQGLSLAGGRRSSSGETEKVLRAERNRESLATHRRGRGPRIPPQRSGGDWHLPDRRLPDRRDALQAMLSVTQNGCTGGTRPGVRVAGRFGLRRFGLPLRSQ